MEAAEEEVVQFASEFRILFLIGRQQLFDAVREFNDGSRVDGSGHINSGGIDTDNAMVWAVDQVIDLKLRTPGILLAELVP